MNELMLFFEKGLRYILDLSVFNPILFLVALSIPYALKDWKRLFILVTIGTFGYFLALTLLVFEIITLKVNLVQLVVLVLILILSFFNLFAAGKSAKQDKSMSIGTVTLFFGFANGLICSSYFDTISKSSFTSTILPLLEFSLGVQIAQIIVITIVLLFSYLVQMFFRFSKRDWTLVISSLISGVVLPAIIRSEIWN